MESQVYNEDCMAVMSRYPDKYFDLAVVDPPYGIGMDGQKYSTSKKGGRRAKPFKNWDNQIPDETYFTELFRVSQNQIIWGANYFTKYLPASMGWIFWDKGQRIKNSDGELAFTSFQKALRVVGLNRVYLLEYGDTEHPTQKPVRLYDYIFSRYAKPTDKILDTHLGSGSSRIAAHRAGLDFIGCEIDKDYFDAQEKRFNQYRSQLNLFQ
jgi:site-specific DNA-methyltransferase (adenine-specific)